MDDRIEQLQADFRETSRRLAELKVQLDLASGKVPAGGVPHYILIEEAAREVGAEVSRLAQQIHLRELTSRHVGSARCPGCGSLCELEVIRRPVISGDGPVELQDLKGHCPSCRRDFFPSAGSAGL